MTAPAATLIAWVITRRRCRLTRSAMTPPNKPRRRVGSIEKNPTSATSQGASVISRVSQANRIICIQRDVYIKALEPHNRA